MTITVSSTLRECTSLEMCAKLKLIHLQRKSMALVYSLVHHTERNSAHMMGCELRKTEEKIVDLLTFFPNIAILSEYREYFSQEGEAYEDILDHPNAGFYAQQFGYGSPVEKQIGDENDA